MVALNKCIFIDSLRSELIMREHRYLKLSTCLMDLSERAIIGGGVGEEIKSVLYSLQWIK